MKKYTLGIGHKKDQFFVLDNGMIREVYYSRARAEEAVAYFNKVKL